MAVNTLKDKAEKSTVRLNDVHEEKMASLQSSIASLQDVIPDFGTPITMDNPYM